MTLSDMQTMVWSLEEEKVNPVIGAPKFVTACPALVAASSIRSSPLTEPMASSLPSLLQVAALN